MKKIIKTHYLALAVAILVGLIYIIPYLAFIIFLGDQYQGIPIMQINDEDNYLMRMQEIVDGHPMVGSPVFYEYKDQWPMMPSAGEHFYALPSLIFNISLINILIISKFVFPFILFLLIYFLIRNLTVEKNLLSNKINAVAGSLLVLLGYDLVDYRNLWLLIKGEVEPVTWLIWSRPVNPIIGAMLLISVLLCAWLIVKKSKYRHTAVIAVSVFLAIMMFSYFFSWGMTLSVLGFLIIIYLLKKQYRTAGNLLAIVVLALVWSGPYWYGSWQASQSPWHQEAIARMSLTQTHQPIFNKFLLATLAVFLILVIWSAIKNNKYKLKDWHYFSLAFIFGGLLAFNQQVITGLAIWPFHFVQYSIPLCMIVLSALLYNIIKSKWRSIWILGISFLIIFSVTYGIYWQWQVYKIYKPDFVKEQVYGPLYKWINNNTIADSVILINEEEYYLARQIPIFTHNNVYVSRYKYTLIPDYQERFLHNYLILLRLREIKPDELEEYLKQEENKNEVAVLIGNDWHHLTGAGELYDPDTSVEKILSALPEQYKNFYEQDFIEQLKKYRLDYILSVNPLSEELSDLLSENTELIYEYNNFYLYRFK